MVHNNIPLYIDKSNFKQIYISHHLRDLELLEITIFLTNPPHSLSLSLSLCCMKLLVVQECQCPVWVVSSYQVNGCLFHACKIMESWAVIFLVTPV